MEIKGCSALVTGGGTGIGAAIAADLCRAGAKVMIAGRRADRLAETAETLAAAGGEITYRPSNIGQAAECQALVHAAVAAHGPIDILVNCAGVLCHGQPIESYGVEDWDGTMDINLRAPFLLTAAVLPSMKARGRGWILMVSSDSGINYFPNQVIYGLSKHGMNDLVQFILAEYKQYGIHAAAICPGLTATEMGLSLGPNYRERVLDPAAVAAWASWLITQPDNLNVARPLVLSPRQDPWI
jgi:NAD(P)-dependent dehydrogenase (short-subunit alcohol dehydrogenase family)